MTDKFGWTETAEATDTPAFIEADAAEDTLTDIVQTEQDVGTADETLPVEEDKEEKNLPM